MEGPSAMAESPLPSAENPADLTSSSAPESQTSPTDPAPTGNPGVEISPPCRFFLEGRCRFGARCHNPHPNDATNAPNLEDHRPTSQDLPPHHPSGKKPAMKTAEDVISRLLWDTQVPADRFSIGYLDRFLGTLEEPFTAFSWEDLASAGPGVLAIPKHRIQYFKYGGRVVWDKASRTDDVFGSTGSGKTILRVIEEAAVAEAIREEGKNQASGGEEGNVMAGGRTRHPGEKVDNLGSANDVEKGTEGAVGRQEVMRELEEAMDNFSTEHAILDESEVTNEVGGKAVKSGRAGRSMEEAELSEPVLDTKQGHLPMTAEAENDGGSQSQDFPSHRQRPTHFVAIQITSSETREAVRHLQEALCEVCPDLAKFCVPLATLHLTLCLLRLDTPEDIYRAVVALRELQANSRRLLPPALLLSFQGVEAFHSHVLYLRPASAVELGTLAHLLEEAFCRKDLTVIRPPSKEKFHLTVVKIPPGKLGPQLPADSSWIPHIEDLGTQAVEAICLCEAGRGRRTDGFYTTVLKLDLY